jgi:hypothetical protein
MGHAVIILGDSGPQICLLVVVFLQSPCRHQRSISASAELTGGDHWKLDDEGVLGIVTP